MSDIVIVSAARTPVGSFNGSFSDMSAADLGSIAIKEAINRAKVKTSEVSEVIMGQVLTASCGQNPARQASINAGIPNEITAYTINQVCGSGLRSIALGWQSIMNDESEIIVAGGQENMTQAPHCFHLRQTGKMGDAEMIDSMIKDGIWDISDIVILIAYIVNQDSSDNAQLSNGDINQESNRKFLGDKENGEQEVIHTVSVAANADQPT